MRSDARSKPSVTRLRPARSTSASPTRCSSSRASIRRSRNGSSARCYRCSRCGGSPDCRVRDARPCCSPGATASTRRSELHSRRCAKVRCSRSTRTPRTSGVSAIRARSDRRRTAERRGSSPRPRETCTATCASSGRVQAVVSPRRSSPSQGSTSSCSKPARQSAKPISSATSSTRTGGSTGAPLRGRRTTAASGY